MKRVNWLGNVPLGLLVVLDLALVILVFMHGGGGSAAGAPVATPTASGTSAAPTTTAAPARPTLTPGLLSVVDTKNAWSATKGTCGKGGAQVSRTSNAGGTWTATKEQPYRAVTRLEGSSGRSGFAVGAGSSCAVAIRSTTNGGDAWRDPTTVGTSWAVDIADPTVLHSTAGTTSTPCRTVHITAFARSSDSAAAVLCEDDTTRRTTDAGGSWTKGPAMTSVNGLADVYGLAATGSGSRTRLVAAATTSGCAGVEILVAPAGKDFAPAACVADVAGTSLPVALDEQGDSAGTIWLLAGTQLWHASGGFATWAKAS